MKKLWSVLLLMAMLFTGVVFAGEREELPSWVKRFKLSADARLRYHYDRKEGEKEEHRDRWRIRLRVGGQFEVADWVWIKARIFTDYFTFGDTENTSDDKIPVGFDRYYVHLKPYEFLEIMAGGFEGPFATSTLVYDAWYTLQGFMEHFKYKVGAWRFGLMAGQTMMNEPFWVEGDYLDAARAKNNGYLFVNKAYISYEMPSMTIMPSVTHWNYTAMEAPEDEGADVQDYKMINPALVLKLLFIESLPISLYTDFVVNTEADEDDFGFQLGATLGGLNKAGDFALGGSYKRVEANATYGAKADSDNGFPVNGSTVHGFVSYAFTEWWNADVLFWYTEQIEGDDNYTNLKIQTTFSY